MFLNVATLQHLEVLKSNHVVVFDICRVWNFPRPSKKESQRLRYQVGHCPTKLENVQPMSNQCPTEIEIEKELNIDIKTEVEAENRKLSSATAELCL